MGQLFDIFLFAIFMFLVALFPLTINNHQVFFINGISIVVFLIFGLFVEIVLTQMTVILVLFNAGVRKQESFRFPLNMISFTIVSFASAEVYKLLGGNHSAINYEKPIELFAIIGYAITFFLVNQLLNKLIDYYIYRREIRIFDKGEKWELMSLLLIIPVGYVLFVLYSEIGRSGIFYLGIPFVFISIILQLLYSYQELNEYLERTSEIGHQLTKRLERNEVYDVFIKEITSLLPLDYAYIYMVKNDRYLKLEQFYNKANVKVIPFDQLKKNESFSGQVWQTELPLMFNRAKEWVSTYTPKTQVDVESILSLPIEYDSDVIGVVTIASKRKKAFEKFHFQILDIVTTYLGVAIENAKNLELTKAKSEIDGLTQLYNYHYFENKLNNYEEKLQHSNDNLPYSLLLLDLDHFKVTNDTYGHEAGNEVLHQVAARLAEHVDEGELLARYGGEEFAILLPGADSAIAIERAENIRSAISNRAFVVHKHILGSEKPVQISVTASIGIATYPVHCKTLHELIRHADRAMYIGAKQKGRDRVALYENL